MKDKIVRIASIGRRKLFRNEYGFFPVWERLSFPHRPTLEEVAVYREYIGSPKDQITVLILGATPELRDLLTEFASRVVLVDISSAMFRGMLAFAKNATPANEVWFQKDWLEMPFPENFFDVVLGDLSLRHVHPRDQEKLLSKLALALRPGGNLIIRHHIVNPKYKSSSYISILDEMGAYPFLEKKYEAMGILLSRLFDASTVDQQIDLKAIAKGIREYLDTGRPSFLYRFFLYEFFNKRIRGFSRRLASQEAGEIEDVLGKHFLILEKKTAASYPEAAFYPIYLLKPQS